MKVLKYVFIAFIMIVPYESQSQTTDLSNFLIRFKEFAATHYPKIKWSMPLINPESRPSPMPNAIDPAKSYMEDPETGLRIFPQLNKVYDPKTGYTINYDPEISYHVDLKAGKIYKDQSEVKIERH